jgi:hypothetical protein
MAMERDAEEQRYRNELRETMKDPPFQPETFGDRDSTERISDSIMRRGVVSVALFNGDCSAICISFIYSSPKSYSFDTKLMI